MTTNTGKRCRYFFQRFGHCLSQEKKVCMCVQFLFCFCFFGSYLKSFDVIYSMEHYLQKTYYKTGSLISNSCKAIAILAGQTAEVSMLAYDYGRNLVCLVSNLSLCPYSLLSIFTFNNSTSNNLLALHNCRVWPFS